MSQTEGTPSPAAFPAGDGATPGGFLLTLLSALTLFFVSNRADSALLVVLLLVGALLLVLAGAIWARRSHPAANRVGGLAAAAAAGPLLAVVTGPTVGLAFSALLFAATSLAYFLSESGDTSDLPLHIENLPSVQRISEERDAQIRRLLSTLDELEKAGIQLTGTSTSLAATAREQEASIGEQAAAATQIMATSREINATSRELANTMGEVAATADETSELATVGQSLLTRMQTTMDQVVTASRSIASKLSTLNERANKIGTVVVTIAKVADQTNLLSLNAAIEAEKAGEFGRGFGVVATEIRRLADQTAVSTLDIEHMIREMLSAVSSGVMGMEKFTEDVRQSADTAHDVVDHLGHIIRQVQTMNERFELVNFGMRSQAQGAEQITDSIGQLSEATHHTANSIKEFNQSIEALQQATQQLAGTVLRGRSDQGR